MTVLRFGANHTPSGDWFFDWMSPDRDRRRRDFEALAGLGLDHVRLLPLWPVLQPNRTFIRREAVDHVREAVETAAEFGLDASVDVIQGHLSSFDFVPAWLTSWHAGNIFTDPDAVQAQVRLVSALDEALSDEPNFLGLTLGNEVNQFLATSHPQAMPATPEDVTAWLEALHADGARDPRQFRLNAEYDAVWYDDTHAFLPSHAARFGDMSVIHSWVFNGTAQKYGALSEEGVRHAEYLIELAAAFAASPARPVWLQEVGAPMNHIAERDAPDFLERTVRSAADSASLWGVTWWCSHDVSRRFGDFPELEHSLGLLDENGAVKPIGRRFAEVAADLRQRAARPATRTVAVIVPVDNGDRPLSRAELSPGGGVFETWMRLAADGSRPALVTSNQASRSAMLAARGVDRLVDAPLTGRSFYSAVSDAEMFPPVTEGHAP
ncbi:glycosyl hydrolase [Microbacterium sp. VKM Ac-2923]|uniref:glycoside hydrolase 5 family protein n=1 Tax=Microbacterium sp. VKM Ac-2923 TaxID=2929476 RepID=UPI001FB226B4|nr:glycosyl hydrolase [Microbacterium sp. VKM Ac-2923]MCJ1708764.1 glycosyl hydrolase [Microbacterium sp. VKM Ac-2923]